MEGVVERKKERERESYSLTGLVVSKLHAYYLLGDTGKDWVWIPIGVEFQWQFQDCFLQIPSGQ